jgi:hypothetical protein
MSFVERCTTSDAPGPEADPAAIQNPGGLMAENWLLGIYEMGCSEFTHELHDVEAEFGCVLSEQLEFLVAISLLAVIGSFVHVLVDRTSACDRPIGRAGGPWR